MNKIKRKKSWKLTKKVLPQHTDHAGVMWHGSYLNFLEEARIDALNKVGISYSELSNQGFEIPVINIQINYKLPFFHGELVHLESEFKLVNKIRLSCKTFFIKSNGEVVADALIQLVVVKKRNSHIKLVRDLPVKIQNVFSLLEEGSENLKD